MRFGATHLEFGRRTWIMGIVNVTTDSFSGDGLLGARSLEELADAAAAQASRMVAEGADILDVGGESTRPGHAPVEAETERRHVEAAVTAIRSRLPGIPISVDTSKEVVASAALDAGADAINDVSAVRSGAALARLAASRGVPYIVMHARSRADHRDVVAEVVSDLDETLRAAEAAGCSRESLIVDPGIGFAKTAEQNLSLLAGIAALRVLGRPILLGTSRKSTIGHVLGLPVGERLEGTLATTALGIAAGVDLVRVHDVAANVRAARMADAIVRGGWQDSGDG